MHSVKDARMRGSDFWMSHAYSSPSFLRQYYAPVPQRLGAERDGVLIGEARRQHRAQFSSVLWHGVQNKYFAMLSVHAISRKSLSTSPPILDLRISSISFMRTFCSIWQAYFSTKEFEPINECSPDSHACISLGAPLLQYPTGINRRCSRAGNAPLVMHTVFPVDLHPVLVL